MDKYIGSPKEFMLDPLGILERRIDTNQPPESLIVEVRHALYAWGVYEPDSMFGEYSVISLAVAHNVLVGAHESGELEEISNPAGYWIGCAQRIEFSMGRSKRTGRRQRGKS